MNRRILIGVLLASVAVIALSVYTVGLGLTPPLAAAPPAPKGDFAWPGALPPWFTAMPAETGADGASTTTQPRALPAGFAPGETLAGPASPAQDIRSGTPANVDADLSQATTSEACAPFEHQYYVPFDDAHLWTLFDAKNTGLPGVQVCHLNGVPVSGTLNSSIFLIASSDRTIYYYDHWEDGYDDEPRLPGVTTTTEVGMLDAGVSKVFQDNIDPALVGDPNRCFYDGRDRITIVGEEATVVRMAYPSTPGSVLAAAWEVPERADWDREYLATLGEDLDFNGATADDHDFVGLEIMAADPGTEIYYNGSLTAMLGPGETFFINGANNGRGDGGVDSTDHITATNDIQVQMMTGGCGDRYSAHGYSLQPVNAWYEEYWAPVPGFVAGCGPSGRNADTDLYLHNPRPYDISVTVSSDMSTLDIGIPPETTVSVLDETGWTDLSTENHGTHLYSQDTFWGVGVIDSATNGASQSELFDWGYSLVPASKLSSQVIVGYAPGNDDDLPTDNANQAFVTTIADTVIYVDLDPDGLPDPFDMNGNGDQSDFDVFDVPEWDEPFSALGIPLQAGQALRVGDPNDRNLEGALIHARDLEAKIAVAWGQDPCQALVGSPYLDLGYTVPPLSIPRLSKTDDLAIDADLTGTASPGDTITYTLVVHNNGRGVMNNVVLTDPLPYTYTKPYTYTNFVVGSLSVSTPPPIHTREYSNDGVHFDAAFENPDIRALRVTWPSIGPGRMVTVTFRVQIRTDIPVDVYEISDQAVVGSSDTDPTPSVDPDDPDDPDTDTPTGRPLLSIDKRVSPPTVQPGGRITYTLVVSNYGDGVALLTAITDVLPSWMEYVPHTLDLTWPIAQVEITTRTLTSTSSFHGNYADDFDLTVTQTTNYAGSDGSLHWFTDWTEVNDDDPSDPGSGEVQVSLNGDAFSEPAHLWIRNADADDAGVERTMDLSDFVSPTLRYYVSGNTDLDGDDDYRVEVSGIPPWQEEYSGDYAYRKRYLPPMAGDPVTLTFLATGGLEAGEWYRFDHIAISESEPFRVVTRTLVEEHTVLSYTTRMGGDPVLYDPLTGYMVITEGMRLPVVDRHGFVTATFQARVTVPLTDVLTLDNTACTTSSNWLNVLLPPCDDAKIWTQANHVLTITKTALPSPARIGGLLAYTVNYTITGNEAVESAVVSDTTPVTTTFYSATPTPISDPGVGHRGPVIWQVDGLWPPGSGITQTTGTLAMVVRVDLELISGTLIHNAVIITDTTGLTDTDEVTTPVVAAPGLELIKTLEPTRTVPNMPFTYTLHIVNTGSYTFTSLVLTDTLPTADFQYIVGSGRPSDPDDIAEPTLVWQNLGPLAPAASLTVAFQVTTSLPHGTYTNTATVEGVYPGGTLTATDDAPILCIVEPAVAVEKSVIGQDRDLGVHERVTFTIAITNVGPSKIAVLPLEDHYETGFLRFVDATPHPDKDDDGLLNWDDLTASGPCGLDRDLPPGKAFVILTVFETITKGTTVNTAIVRGATDIYGNPADEVKDPHGLTPVILRYFRAVAEPSAVRLEWATALEVDCVGFYIYRDEDATIGGAQPIAYVAATGPGSTYSYVDRDVTPGQVHWYWLAEVSTAGSETMYGPVWAGVGPDGLSVRIYLPLIEKDWR
jgi:uncharacterized repeat protein (TIGR01451 family)